MNKSVNDSVQRIIQKLKEAPGVTFGAFLGFDACIDNIVRVVKEKDENDEHGFYSNSRDFAEFLISRENRSCGIELHTHLSKTGGNMVITGNALGNLGVKADCVGTFGFPEILPVFKSISPNCILHTVGETITATALEFNDSKFILFDPGPYDNLTWEGIKTTLGLKKLTQLFSGKQLISLLNWSEIRNSTAIWEGILDDILPALSSSARAEYFFTDLSDCSRKSKEEIKSAIKLLSRFRKYFRVVISLNQNEAEMVSAAFDLKPVHSDEDFVKSLFKIINSDILVLHRPKDAISFDGISYEKCDTFFCKEPRILTGGGDNFNAGYCFSLLNNFDPFQSLLVANAVSGSYVKTGISPDVAGLILQLNLLI